MKKILLLLIMCTFLFSCNKNVHLDDSREQYGYLMMTPDSLLTDSEKNAKSKIADIFFSKSEIVQNRVVLKFDKEDFAQAGLPGKYFDYAKEDIDNFNKGADLSNVDLEDLFQEYKQKFQKTDK